MAETAGDVRKADRTMLNALQRLKRRKLDSRVNIAQGEKLIQLKIGLEDRGVLRPGSFAQLDTKHDVTPKMISKLKDLEQEGYGGEDAIDKLRKRMAKFAKKQSSGAGKGAGKKRSKYANAAVPVIKEGADLLRLTKNPFAMAAGDALKDIATVIDSFPRDKISLPELKQLARMKKGGDRKGIKKLIKKIRARK
jgi:hypothetical protein